MSDKAAINLKAIPGLALGLLAWVIASAVGRAAGATLLFPAAFGATAYFALKKFRPSADQAMRWAVSAQFAQLGWMSLALFFAPETAGQVAGDIAVLVILLPLLLLRGGLLWSGLLLAYQLLSISVNIYSLAEHPDRWLALAIHIGLRATAIFYLAQIFRSGLRARGRARNKLREAEPAISVLDRLERLGALKERGILTVEEFDAQKAAILKSADPN